MADFIAFLDVLDISRLEQILEVVNLLFVALHGKDMR